MSEVSHRNVEGSNEKGNERFIRYEKEDGQIGELSIPTQGKVWDVLRLHDEDNLKKEFPSLMMSRSDAIDNLASRLRGALFTYICIADEEFDKKEHTKETLIKTLRHRLNAMYMAFEGANVNENGNIVVEDVAEVFSRVFDLIQKFSGQDDIKSSYVNNSQYSIWIKSAELLCSAFDILGLICTNQSITKTELDSLSVSIDDTGENEATFKLLYSFKDNPSSNLLNSIIQDDLFIGLIRSASCIPGKVNLKYKQEGKSLTFEFPIHIVYPSNG